MLVLLYLFFSIKFTDFPSKGFDFEINDYSLTFLDKELFTN
jgi:hypothetical protein